MKTIQIVESERKRVMERLVDGTVLLLDIRSKFWCAMAH
jgi:hypothetical protein